MSPKKICLRLKKTHFWLLDYLNGEWVRSGSRKQSAADTVRMESRKPSSTSIYKDVSDWRRVAGWAAQCSNLHNEMVARGRRSQKDPAETVFCYLLCDYGQMVFAEFQILVCKSVSNDIPSGVSIGKELDDICSALSAMYALSKCWIDCRYCRRHMDPIYQHKTGEQSCEW